jgi:hypothetical protein
LNVVNFTSVIKATDYVVGYPGFDTKKQNYREPRSADLCGKGKCGSEKSVKLDVPGGGGDGHRYAELI